MRTRFITSAVAADGFPMTEVPEVAFIGRSNVGKSSLLNRLSGAKIARTSRSPGRTQMVNFFELHGGKDTVSLADLPGYGFAKVPKSVRIAWTGLIEAYLSERKPLAAVLMLLDLRRSPVDEDQEIYGWIREVRPDVELWLVGTKADKMGKAKRKPAAQGVGAAFGGAPVAITSAQSGEGLERLRRRILHTGG